MRFFPCPLARRVHLCQPGELACRQCRRGRTARLSPGGSFVPSLDDLSTAKFGHFFVEYPVDELLQRVPALCTEGFFDSLHMLDQLGERGCRAELLRDGRAGFG